MSLVVRFSYNFLHWEVIPGELPWLPQDEMPADPLKDLKTDGNRLSIYLVQDQNIELGRLLSAFAASKTSGLDKLDYVLFDEKIIKDLNIKYDYVLGNTLDNEVNLTHRNLCELTANLVVRLAKSIFTTCIPQRKNVDEVDKLIKISINNGWINKDSLNRSIKRDLIFD